MNAETVYDLSNKDGVIRCRLSVLLAQKQDRERRKKKYTIRDVAAATELSPAIIHRYMNDNFERIDKHTVERLCRFLDCGICDLLSMESDEVKSE